MSLAYGKHKNAKCIFTCVYTYMTIGHIETWDVSRTFPLAPLLGGYTRGSVLRILISPTTDECF